MAAMAVVSGNTTASNRSMGQPLNRGTASLQYLDEMSMAYSASDNDCTLESATPGGSTRRSDARRSRPLSSSFDGRQRHGYATAHVEHNIIRQKWPSDSWNVVDQPVAPPERLAATATNRKLQATEVGEKPISLDAVDDDFTMSVTTATTPLASPPPPFRHHLLFPPLGFDGITTEADDVNTGGKHRSNVAVYAEVRIGEEGPAAATAARMNSDCGDVQLQQLGLSTAATPHADAGDDDVVMQHRFNAVDDQSDNIRESSVSSSTERSMECRLNLSLEDVRTGCKPAIAAVAPPVGLGIVRSSEWMSVSDTSAGTAAVGCSNDSFDSTAVRAQESPMSSMPTAFTSTPVGVRCSIRQVEPPRRLSISADGGSSRHAIRPAAAEFENRNFSDAGDTPVNESQCPAALQLYQLAAGASAPVSFATGGGSRNPASRKLIYDIERVMAAPVTGTGTRKQQLPASCQRRQRRMRDGSSCAAVAATEFRHMSVVLPPSSSSYLSDSSSSSSSASSPSVSPYKEVNRRTLRTAGLTAVPPIPPITSGARRRRGHRTAAAPSQPKDMRSVRSDLASGRRLVFSQQRDSSTDHQTWDEYQVGPYPSNGDDEGEEKLDAGSLVQSDWWTLHCGLQNGNDVNRRRLRRPPASSHRSSVAVKDSVEELQRSATGANDQVRRRANITDAAVDYISRGAVGKLGAATAAAAAATDDDLDIRDRAAFVGCREVKDAKDDVIRGIESDLTTDSDAEDLEQLVTDSRQALHLTRAALDDVKRRATTAAAVNYDGPEDGAGNVAVTVDAVSRTRQLKLNEEIATCRTNIDCLEQCLDALNNGTRQDISALATDIHILSDLLAQWRSLEVDIINLIASRLSSSKSTTTTAFSSDDSGHSQGTSVSWSPTSANSSNILAETAGRQRHSFQHQQQQHEERTYARDMRDSGIIIDDDGCNFLSVVEENAATGDRRLYHISADATLVDEMLTNRNNSSLGAVAANKFSGGVEFSRCFGVQTDLESLESATKRRPSKLHRICNTVSRTCFSDSNGTLLLLKTMLLLLIALAIVAVVLNQCYTATGKFYCRPDVSLAVNPRLRYVLGPPPT